MDSAEGNPRFVIRAGEYKTEKGDLIGLFLKEEIRSRKSNELAREIHAQGGLVVLPHPYKGHRLDGELLDQVDLIETFNGRCTTEQNDSARALACRLNRPEIAGSDAHCAAEICVALTEFEIDRPVHEDELPAMFRTAPRRLRAAPVSRIYQPYSGLIKACRTFDVMLFGHQLKKVVSIASGELFS